MTVKELIDELLLMDPSRRVILQKDAEGNGYSPLAGVDENCRYEAETTWSGHVGLDYLTPEHEEQGFGEEDLSDGEPVVVLFPVN